MTNKPLAGLIALLAAGPAFAETPAAAPAAPEAAPAPAPAAPAAPAANDLDSHLKKLDELWKVRDQGDAPKQYEAELKAAQAAAPNDIRVLNDGARWIYWQAEIATADAAKERLSKQAWDLAEQAVAKDPQNLDAHYWAAVSSGVYGDTIGVLKALSKGMESKFRSHLDLCVAKQPSFDFGGPLVTLGRYYFKLPWPKHDAKKSMENLRAAMKLNPNNLRARVFLADTLLDEGEPKEALKLVDEVLAAKPGAYDAPEERHSQQLARNLKPRIEEKLK